MRLTTLLAESGNRVPIDFGRLGAADWLTVGVLLGSVVLFGVAGAFTMSWAFRTGQFDNFTAASRSIFDPDEPIGETTDHFPGEAPEGRDD
jgi:nitrogen fixation-related uncharacterized protein